MNENNNNSQSSNNNKSSIIILILVIAVIVGVVGYSIYSKSSDDNSDISQDNSISDTITDDAQTSEITNETLSENQTSANSLDAVSDCYQETYDVSFDEGGGMYGVLVEFTSVENADGYVIRVIYDELDSSSDVLDRISSEESELYFESQNGPVRIDIRPYKENDTRDDITYGEWETLYDVDLEDYDNPITCSYTQWEDLISDRTEIYLY
jgi:hypothetical protein